jgi:hypothetical protein
MAAEQNANGAYGRRTPKRVMPIHLRHTEPGQQAIERHENMGVWLDMT